MFSILGWLPVVGPIVDGVVSIFKGKQDLDIAKGAQRLEEVRLRLAYLEAVKDQTDIRVMRDLMIFPVIVWAALGTWDTIVAESAYSEWMFHVAKFPPGPLEYLPFAVLAYLFGLQMKKMF